MVRGDERRGDTTRTEMLAGGSMPDSALTNPDAMTEAVADWRAELNDDFDELDEDLEEWDDLEDDPDELAFDDDEDWDDDLDDLDEDLDDLIAEEDKDADEEW
jgi:hypothetical protein